MTDKKVLRNVVPDVGIYVLYILQIAELLIKLFVTYFVSRVQKPVSNVSKFGAQRFV